MFQNNSKKKKLLVRIITWIILIPLLLYISMFASALLSGMSLQEVTEGRFAIIYSSNILLKRFLPAKSIDFNQLLLDYDNNSVLAMKNYNNKYYKFYIYVDDSKPSNRAYLSNPKDYFLVKVYDSKGYRDSSIISNSNQKYASDHFYAENECYDEWNISNKPNNNYWMWFVTFKNEKSADILFPGRLYEIKGCLSVQPSAYATNDIYCSISNAKIIKIV